MLLASQTRFIDRIVAKFGLDNAKPFLVPHKTSGSSAQGSEAEHVMITVDTAAGDAKLSHDSERTCGSTGGHVLFPGPSLIPSLSNVWRQPILTLSTTAESELIQIRMCAGCAVCNVCEGLGFQQVTITLNEDNQTALLITGNPFHWDCPKHLGPKAHVHQGHNQFEGHH